MPIAAADEAFVNGYLLPKLGLASERVFRRQTLELDRFITEEIERGVRSSRVTVVVLSAACTPVQFLPFAHRGKVNHGITSPQDK